MWCIKDRAKQLPEADCGRVSYDAQMDFLIRQVHSNTRHCLCRSKAWCSNRASTGTSYEFPHYRTDPSIVPGVVTASWVGLIVDYVSLFASNPCVMPVQPKNFAVPMSSGVGTTNDSS